MESLKPALRSDKAVSDGVVIVSRGQYLQSPVVLIMPNFHTIYHLKMQTKKASFVLFDIKNLKVKL